MQDARVTKQRAMQLYAIVVAFSISAEAWAPLVVRTKVLKLTPRFACSCRGAPLQCSAAEKERQQAECKTIMGYGKTQQLDEAVALLDSITCANAHHYNAALTACELARSSSAAVAVYGTMTQTAVAPNAVTHLPLMRCLLRDRQYRAVLALCPRHRAACEGLSAAADYDAELSMGYNIAIKAAEQLGDWQAVSFTAAYICALAVRCEHTSYAHALWLAHACSACALMQVCCELSSEVCHLNIWCGLQPFSAGCCAL
jgi:hypothetical protein